MVGGLYYKEMKIKRGLSVYYREEFRKEWLNEKLKSGCNILGHCWWIWSTEEGTWLKLWMGDSGGKCERKVGDQSADHTASCLVGGSMPRMDVLSDGA